MLILLCASAFGPGPAERKPDRVISIVAERFTFNPSKVTVKQGELMEFVLTSDDTDHGFRIPERGHRRGDSAAGKGEVRVRFVAKKKGRFVFECSRPCGAGPQPDARNDRGEVRLHTKAMRSCRGMRPGLAGLSFSQSGRPPALPGSPLPGITATELEMFRAGAARTSREVETAEDGLGPAFNGNSCAVCHSVPAIGGVSTMTEMRGGYRDEDGKFHALNGGTLYHLFSTPPHRCQVQIPAGSERDRAARADTAIRRGTGGGDCRRDDSRAGGSGRPRRRWHTRAGRAHYRRR